MEENANLVKTTKYSFFNFIPKNLFEQFHKIANVYFLLLVILQFVPAFGVTSAALGIIPLLFILVATATKDGFEDFKRYQQDKFVNSQNALVVESLDDTSLLPNPSNLNSLKWKDIGVGRLIYIPQDQPIPTDCLIIATSDPGGICYVETKNLDGETNLKIYESALLRNDDQNDPLLHKWLNKDPISIEYEDPSPNLYQFHGTISFNNATASLSFKHLLLRGTILRNTTYAIGLCVYTGPDTKIMLNTRPTPTKRSKIDIQLNPLVAFNFILIFLLCLITAIGYALTNQYPLLSIYPSDYPKYATLIDATFLFNLSFAFGASLILYQNIVPISVYISIEFVKIISAYFINKDLKIAPAIPKSWTISDDLGQIKYIFSDKTGTLTQNSMAFKKCAINGVCYGLTVTDLQARMPNATPTEIQHTMSLLHTDMSTKLNITSVQFIDLAILEHMQGINMPINAIHDKHDLQIHQFFLFLAICHVVVVDQSIYKSQSPDEAALVSTARDMGYVYMGTVNDVINVNVHGLLMQIPLLHVIEFTSTRKRQSVIVTLNGAYMLICKGADSVINARLASDQVEIVTRTNAYLDSFANEGLRTLCVSCRLLTDLEYDTFDFKYTKASNIVDEQREIEMDKIASDIEQELVLVGCTAIDDKLQIGVNQTIKVIHGCGIKLWVLTGDKVETAITIGMSCGLITRDMDVVLVQVIDLEGLKMAIGHLKTNENTCIVIDGVSMGLLWGSDLLETFKIAAMQCRSVLCCRVSPKQKALVVMLIKEMGYMCLAIGDGANDVAMIQTAQIGIGISGKEGMQASMSSDFSISQFRHLSSLLLVHGRWTYMRISLLIVNFFYKNCIWVFTLFYYQFYCGYSTVFLFDYFYLLIYNVLLTLLPVLLLGVFDLDVMPFWCFKYPELYQDMGYFNVRLFLVYLMDAVYASLLVYYTGMIVLPKRGDSVDYYGAMTSIAIIIINNISVGLDIRKWNWYVLVGVIGSAMSLFVIVPIYSMTLYSGSAYGVYWIYGELSFYLYLVVVCYLGILPRLVIKSFNKMCRPRDGDIVMELQKMEKIEEEKGEQVIGDGQSMAEMEVAQIRKESTLGRQASIGERKNSQIMDAVSMGVTGNRGYAYSQGDRGVIGKIKKRLVKRSV